MVRRNLYFMSLTKAQAQSQSTAADEVLTNLENTRFIAAVDYQILDAIAQGKYFVNSNTWPGVDPKEVCQTYIDLGYQVYFPDYPTSMAYQPAQLFGEFWDAFWAQNSYIPPSIKNPVRIIISWE